MSWADRAGSCIDWEERDEDRLAAIRKWLEPEKDGFVAGLVERVSRLDRVPRLLRNDRFAGRLHTVLQEWLSGLLTLACDDLDRQERRRSLGARLARLNISYDEVILIEGMTYRWLTSVITEHVDGCVDELSPTLCALHKAMTYDRGLVHAGFVDLRDSEMEQALLDRFLAITGFSPSLYEGLAETWEQGQAVDTMGEP